MALRREAWFGSYLFVGLAQNGLAPILLPLASKGGAASGLSYAAFALTGLTAPILGSWADRTGRHRDLLVWGCLAAAACFLVMGLVSAGLPYIALAGGAGLGVTAATTAGNVLVIQGIAQRRWDERVADLQRIVSAGQVLGLLLAGGLAASHMRLAFFFAAVALLVAAALAKVLAPRSSVQEHAAKPQPLVGGEAGIPGPRHNEHHMGFGQLCAFLGVINRRLARFLIVWLIAFTAMNGVAVLFPVVMTRQYAMPPILPALAYAVGMGASLLLYRRVSVLTGRFGAGRILTLGLAVRLVLLACLAVFGLYHALWAGIGVLVAFGIVQMVWPLLGVSANALSVELVPAARGESVGLFNAATAVASSVGSAVGGVIFGFFGFSALSAVAFVAVGVGLWLSVTWFGGATHATGNGAVANAAYQATSPDAARRGIRHQ
ncbi:MAG: MFS transporter [Steroidobacteraceae bacterium]